MMVPRLSSSNCSLSCLYRSSMRIVVDVTLDSIEAHVGLLIRYSSWEMSLARRYRCSRCVYSWARTALMYRSHKVTTRNRAGECEPLTPDPCNRAQGRDGRSRSRCSGRNWLQARFDSHGRERRRGGPPSRASRTKMRSCSFTQRSSRISPSEARLSGASSSARGLRLWSAWIQGVPQYMSCAG